MYPVLIRIALDLHKTPNLNPVSHTKLTSTLASHRCYHEGGFVGLRLCSAPAPVVIGVSFL